LSSEDDTLLKCLIDLAESTPKYLRYQLDIVFNLCLKVCLYVLLRTPVFLLHVLEDAYGNKLDEFLDLFDQYGTKKIKAVILNVTVFQYSELCTVLEQRNLFLILGIVVI